MIKYNIPLPRLLDSSLNTVRRLHPVSCSVSQGIEPLDEAKFKLINSEAIPMRSLVEMFTVNGSAGIFRVTQSETLYSEGGTQEVELEHAITILGDTIINEKTGTKLTKVTSDEVIADNLSKVYVPEGSTYRPTFTSSTIEEDEEFIIKGTATSVLTSLLNYQTTLINGVKPWVLGTCAANVNVQRSINYDNLLKVIVDIMGEELADYYLTFNMSVFPWQLNVVARPQTITAEGRLARNVCDFSLSYDDSNLCTRVYCERLASGYQDSPKTAQFGIVGQHLTIDKEAPQAAVNAIITRHLSNYDEPLVSVKLSMQDLAQITGEPMDSISVGKRFRLAIPDYSLTMDEIVIAVDYDNVYGEMGQVDVTLANKAADLSWSGDKRSKTYNNSVGGAGSTAAGASSTASTAKENTKSNKVELIKEMQKKDGQDLLNLRAGIAIDPETGVSIFASKNAGSLGSEAAKIQVQYNQITSTVENNRQQLSSQITQTASELRTDYTDKISNTESHITQTASEIRTEVEDKEKGLKSSIKQNADNISINAQNIQIIADDYVTINRLQSEIGAIQTAIATDVNTSTLEAVSGQINRLTSYGISVDGRVSASILQAGGSDLSKASKFVLTSVSGQNTSSGFWLTAAAGETIYYWTYS